MNRISHLPLEGKSHILYTISSNIQKYKAISSIVILMQLIAFVSRIAKSQILPIAIELHQITLICGS